MMHQYFLKEEDKKLAQQIEKQIETLFRCKHIKCYAAAKRGFKALEHICNGAVSVKHQPRFPKKARNMKAKLSRCNQANAMQVVDTPGSLNMHHPPALSMTPPEPPAVAQTVDCGAPSFLPEAGHPPHQSVLIQLSRKVQPLSQNLLETADSEETAPITLPESIEESGVTKGSSTRTSEPIRATCTIVERPVKKIEKTTSDPRKRTKSNSSGSTEAMTHRAIAAKTQQPTELVFGIVARHAKKMKQRSKSSKKLDQLTFFCLCKVLRAMGVGISRFQDLGLGREYNLPFDQYFDGVVWANRLLEELFKEDSGHQAVDRLLSCKSRSRRCMRGAR